jgi:hypothetical protein
MGRSCEEKGRKVTTPGPSGKNFVNIRTQDKKAKHSRQDIRRKEMNKNAPHTSHEESRAHTTDRQAQLMLLARQIDSLEL